MAYSASYPTDDIYVSSVPAAIRAKGEDVKALVDAIDTTKLGDLRRVFRSTEEPTAVESGDMWVNYSNGSLNTWSGSAWDTDILSVPNYVLTVKAFGALGNWTNDDTQAIQDAADAMSLNGARLYFPAGTYKITSTINFTNGGGERWIGRSIVGDGPDVTWICVTGASGGFSYSADRPQAQLQVSDMTFIAMTDINGAAIYATYPFDLQNLSTVSKSVVVKNVDIRGNGNLSSGTYFAEGIHLHGAINASISNCHVNGRWENSVYIPAQVGIFLDNCIDVVIDNATRLYFWQQGVKLNGHCEGIAISCCKMEYVDYGVFGTYGDSPPVDTSTFPQFTMNQTHINARKRNVKLVNWKEYSIDNCMFYNRGTEAGSAVGSAAVPTHAFIELSRTAADSYIIWDRGSISNVSCFANSSLTGGYGDKTKMDGFVLSGNIQVNIRDCFITGVNAPLVLDANTRNIVAVNIRTAGCNYAANAANNGTNNVITSLITEA